MRCRSATCGIAKFFARATQSPHFFALIRSARSDRCAGQRYKFRAEIAVFRHQERLR